MISAWRSDSPLRLPARRFLGDRARTIVASSLTRLETLPKATFLKNTEELAYYESVFASIQNWVPIDDALVQEAIEIGARYDVVNIDALHVAAAIRARADQFVTTEKPGKSLHRVREIEIVYLLDLNNYSQPPSLACRNLRYVARARHPRPDASGRRN